MCHQRLFLPFISFHIPKLKLDLSWGYTQLRDVLGRAFVLNAVSAEGPTPIPHPASGSFCYCQAGLGFLATKGASQKATEKLPRA